MEVPITSAKRKSLGASITSGKLMLLAMSLPFLALIILFSYVPLLGWIFAFFEGTHLSSTSFIGLKYMKMILTRPELRSVMRNTLAISMISTAFGLFPVMLAIFISELRSTKYQRIVQTLTTIPNFMSWIIVYSVMFFMFASEGVVNTIARSIDPSASDVNVLGNAAWAWIIQCLFSLWKSAGWSAIIYLAAIAGIDMEIYEAALVDGANRFRRIWHITIPGIAETYFVLLVLGLANVLNSGFEQFFVFNNSLVGDKLNVIDYYIYIMGITNGYTAMSTAICIYKSIIGLVLLVIANTVAKKIRGVSIF